MIDHITQILVFKTISVVGQEFQTLQTFDEENAKVFHDIFKRRLKSCKLLLCDEFRHDNHEYLLGDLRDDQHCVLFASAKDETLDSSYQHIHLGASLRSTSKIAQFADSWLKSSSLQNFEFECKPAHNFDGERPDIRICRRPTDNSDSEILELFIEESVSTIVEYAERSRGLEIVPVVPFIDTESRKRVLEGLEARGLECSSPSYSYNATETNAESKRDPTTVSRSSLPTICFFEETDIEGAEFGIVVVLMRHKNPQDIRVGLGQKFFTAVTRASTKLVLVIAEGGSNESTSCIGISDNHVNAKADSLSKIIKENITARTPTVLVGPLSHFEGLRNISDNSSPITMPKIKGIKCFLGPNEEKILQIDDVFKKEDLEALQKYGIRLLVLLNNDSGCEWRFKFFYSTYQCIQAYTKDHKNAFKVCNLLANYADLQDDLQCLETFLYKQKTDDRTSQSNLRVERNPFEAPLPTEYLFNWENWKLKGHEHYHLGHNLLAADRYMQSIMFLEPKYRTHLTERQVELAVGARKDLAKLCTNVSMMYLKHLRSPSDKREELCSVDRSLHEVGATFESCIVTAFDHAIKATEWNACWQKSYERIRDTIEIIRQRSAATGQNKTTADELVIMQQLVQKDLNSKGIHKMKFEPSFPLDGREDIAEAAAEKNAYENRISDNKDQTDTLEDLVKRRKLLSSSYVAVGKKSLDLIKSRTHPEKLINYMLSHKQARQLFDYSVRFAIEALDWNPFEMSARTLIAQSLSRLETGVSRLEQIAGEFGEHNFLSQITEDEIAYS